MDESSRSPAETDRIGQTPFPPVVAAEVDSAELLRGGRELLIRHAGELYRLRLTRNDKLILQK